VFDIQRTVQRDIFLQQKPARCTISQVYFGKELYIFWTYLLSIIRSLNTVYTANDICHASYVECLLVSSVCSILNSLADLRLRECGYRDLPNNNNNNNNNNIVVFNTTCGYYKYYLFYKYLRFFVSLFVCVVAFVLTL